MINYDLFNSYRHQLNHRGVTCAKTTPNKPQSVCKLSILLTYAILLHSSLEILLHIISLPNPHYFIYLSLIQSTFSYLQRVPFALLFLVYNNSKIQKMNSQNNYDLLFKYIVVGDTSNCVV